MDWETCPAKADREINIAMGGYTEVFPKLLLNQRKSDENWITNNRRSLNFKNSNAKSPLGYLKLVYIPPYLNCINNRRPSTFLHKVDAKGTPVFFRHVLFLQNHKPGAYIYRSFLSKILNQLFQHWFWLKLEKCSSHAFVNFCYLFWVHIHSYSGIS